MVNTFSASGGLFGFQVGPRLRALEDPAARKGGSANVLDRQSFPAVLIIGVDQADLSPVICWNYDGRLYVFEPQLVIRQTSRWNPLDRKLFSFSKNDWWNPLDWHNPRYSERDRVDNLLGVADQFKDLDEWLQQEQHWLAYRTNNDYKPESAAEFEAYTHIVQSLKDRRDALAELFTGSESTQYLPLDVLSPGAQVTTAPTMPQVTRIFPESATVTLAKAGAAEEDKPRQTFIIMTQGMKAADCVKISLWPAYVGK